MAGDIGEEAEVPVGLPECILRPLPVGDLLGGADAGDNRARIVFDGRDSGDVVPVAAGVRDPDLDDIALSRGKDPGERAKALVRLVLVKDIPDLLPDDLVHGLAHAVGKRLVDIPVGPVRVEREDGVGGLVEEDAVLLLTLAERDLRFALLG